MTLTDIFYPKGLILNQFFYSGLVRSEYTVKVWSPSTWVNPGDSYVAYCNIPDLGAFDIVRNLEVMWFHNSQQLTSLCEFLSSELTLRYFCNVRSPQINNISLAITLTSKCWLIILVSVSDQCFEKMKLSGWKGS